VNIIIHTFGTGHSHLIAEEAFFRAGGIAAVNPILDIEVINTEPLSGADQVSGLGRPVVND